MQHGLSIFISKSEFQVGFTLHSFCMDAVHVSDAQTPVGSAASTDSTAAGDSNQAAEFQGHCGLANRAGALGFGRGPIRCAESAGGTEE